MDLIPNSTDALVGARLILGLIFVGAAVAKSRQLTKTREFLARLGLPAWTLPWAAPGVIATEAITGISLLVGLPRLGGAAAAGLFATFIVVLLIADKKSVPCTCFGGSESGRLREKLAWRSLGLVSSLGLIVFAEEASQPPSLTALALVLAAAAVVPARNPAVRAAVHDLWLARIPAHARDVDPAAFVNAESRDVVVRRRFLKTTGVVFATSVAAPFTAFGKSLGISPCYPECEPDEQCYCSSTGQCYCTPKAVPTPPPPPPTPAVLTEAERIAACTESCIRQYECEQMNCGCLVEACEQGWVTKLPGALNSGVWGVRLWITSGFSCINSFHHCNTLAGAAAADCGDECIDDPTYDSGDRPPAYVGGGSGASKWDHLPALAAAIEIEEGAPVARDWLLRRLDMQVFLPVTLFNELVIARPDSSPERVAVWLFLHEVASERASEMVHRSATADIFPKEARRNASLLKTISRAAEAVIDALPADALKAGSTVVQKARMKATRRRTRASGVVCCWRQREHLSSTSIVVPRLADTAKIGGIGGL